MKRVRLLVGVLFVLAIVGVVGVTMDIYLKDKFIQGVTVQIIDEKGYPVSAKILINELTENGPKQLWKGSGVGIASVNLVLPKKEITTLEVGDKRVKVYKSINLEVVAYTKGKIGIAIFSVDPAEAKPKNVKIVLRDVPKIKSEPTPGVWTKYEYTPVLKFATWDDIFAKYSYPRGAKIKIESKARPYGSPTWLSGYTEVTLDDSLSSPYLTGENIYTVYFKIKYVYAITELDMSDEKIYYEKVYAVDTSSDPIEDYRDRTGWNGHLPTDYDDYRLTYARNTRDIPITGGYDYTFSVSVGFSYPAGITVSLGVTKIPSPTATLSITSTRHSGWVKTVGFDGFLESYSNWYL